MKELEKHDLLNKKVQTEIVMASKKNNELKHIGSIRPLTGHTLWEIDTKTLSVKKAEYAKTHTLGYGWKGEYGKQVVIRPHCEYISALNPANALKRYRSGKGSAKMNEQKELLNPFTF